MATCQARARVVPAGVFGGGKGLTHVVCRGVVHPSRSFAKLLVTVVRTRVGSADRNTWWDEPVVTGGRSVIIRVAVFRGVSPEACAPSGVVSEPRMCPIITVSSVKVSKVFTFSGTTIVLVMSVT